MNIEANKIAGAAFGTLLFVVALNIVSEDFIFHVGKPAIPGYALPEPQEEAAPAGGAGVRSS